MKNYSIKNILMCVYVYILLYLFYIFFYSETKKQGPIYQFVERYFGISIFFICFIFILSIIGSIINCKRKKMVFNIRVKFFILLVLSVVVVFFAKQTGIGFVKEVATKEQLRHLTEIGIYKYNLGLFNVFLLNWLFSSVVGTYIYVGSYCLIFISMFFLVAKFIRVTITNTINNIKRKRALERERKLVQEQIKLQEYYERKERERELEEKRQKELEEQIILEREMMEKIGEEPQEVEEQENGSSEEIVCEENRDDEVLTQIDNAEDKVNEINNINKVEEDESPQDDIIIVSEDTSADVSDVQIDGVDNLELIKKEAEKEEIKTDDTSL